MRKVKIILTLIVLSFIMVLNGCDSEVRTAPWSDRDLKRMDNIGQETIPVLRFEF